jgi:diguanylate cyclase (GGDEF)-like protein
VASRVREAFASAAEQVSGKPVNATVSAGVTAGFNAITPVGSLLEEADGALYKAKLNGRNRVEAAAVEKGERTYPRLVKIA